MQPSCANARSGQAESRMRAGTTCLGIRERYLPVLVLECSGAAQGGRVCSTQRLPCMLCSSLGCMRRGRAQEAGPDNDMLSCVYQRQPDRPRRSASGARTQKHSSPPPPPPPKSPPNPLSSPSRDTQLLHTLALTRAVLCCGLPHHYATCHTPHRL